MKKILTGLMLFLALAGAQAQTFKVQNLQVLGTSALQAGGSVAGTFSGTATFSGPLTLQGGTTVTGGGALSGTFTGAPTFSGAYVSSGTPTFTLGAGFSGAAVTFGNGITVTGGAIVPVATTGITGTTGANNAVTGAYGEYLTATTSGTSLSNGVANNCTSVSLTAGDWDISGSIRYIPSGTAVTSNLQSGITTTSATLAGLGTQNTLQVNYITGVAFQEQSTPTVRLSLGATTTVFLAGIAGFTPGTMTCNGFIRARRMR